MVFNMEQIIIFAIVHWADYGSVLLQWIEKIWQEQ